MATQRTRRQSQGQSAAQHEANRHAIAMDRSVVASDAKTADADLLSALRPYLRSSPLEPDYGTSIAPSDELEAQVNRTVIAILEACERRALLESTGRDDGDV